MRSASSIYPIISIHIVRSITAGYKKKVFYESKKKDLFAGTLSKPLMVSKKEDFVFNFFLMNEKNIPSSNFSELIQS